MRLLRADATSLPLADASIDAVVCDPPYGIGFMGREWDTFSPARVEARNEQRRRKGTERTHVHWPESKMGDSQGGGVPIQYDESASGNRRFQEWTELWAREALRVLKPGGHMVVFGGARTFHRVFSGVEDAGFEMRDVLCWLYGSGFPKSLDVSKAIDRGLGAERPILGKHPNPGSTNARLAMGDGWQTAPDITAPATPEAAQWAGWGRARRVRVRRHGPRGALHRYRASAHRSMGRSA